MDVDRPLVSVILPVYNGERYVRAALESVFAQTYTPSEVIVVDDGSTDGTAPAIRAFGGIRYARQANRGVAAARNVGIGLARGDLVAFIDHDDLWMPNKLAVQVRFLLDHPNVAGALCYFKNFVSGGLNESVRDRWNWSDDEQPGLGTGTLTVRKAAFDRIGCFDETYALGEDTDWLFRATEAGLRIAMVHECLLLRRIHTANLTRDPDTTRAAMFRALKASRDRQRRLRASQREAGARGG